MTTYDDHQARSYSLSTTDSIIVKAPAGSGKTELLVQRYLKLLATACDNPRQIIAITFTRKAAAEMRARIRLELQSTEQPQQHKQTTSDLAKQVLARAKEKEWDLDRLISQDTITTIDAFCRTLVALDPIKANFFTMPELVEDIEADELYQQAIEQAIAVAKESEMKDSIAELIYMHNNDLKRLKVNFAQLLKQRAPLLLAIMKEDNDLATGMQVLCQELITRLAGYAPQDLFSNIAQISQQAIEDLDAQNKTDKLPFDPFPSDHNWQHAKLQDWQNLARFLLTGQGSLRKRVNKTIGFSPDTDHKQAMEILLDTIAERVEMAQDDSATENFLYYLARVKHWSNCYEQRELKAAEIAAQFFKLAAAQLQQLFKVQGKCDHTEVMLAALQVMEQEQGPSLLAEKLGYQLRHLLVDEFQDTSTGQLRLLEALCRSWDASSPNTLFLVGDPMQSIYAFRQADVRIFNRLWEDRQLNQVPLNRVVLLRNFRSQQSLVEWCNDRFKNIFPPLADNILDAVVHTSAQATHPVKDSGIHLLGNQINKSNTSTDEALFLPMIAEIKQLLKQPSGPTIAILVSSRHHIKSLIPLLQQHQLDFNAGQITASSSSSHIMDLLSLTSALYDYDDELAWYSCLRAPWCGLSLEDLLFIAHHKQDLSIWQYLYQASQNPPTELAGIEAIRHVVSCLNPIATMTRRTNWSDLILLAWRRLGGDKLLITEQDYHDSQLFFRLLEDNSNGALIDIARLTNQLDSHGAVFDNDSQIQLMTIHKSKGLEFDYVFLPMIHKGWGQGGNSDILLTSDFYSQQQDQAFSLFAIHSPNLLIDEQPAYEMLKQLKEEKEKQEYRRLFYVACTRAKQGLYLHYLIKHDDKQRSQPPSDKSFASLLWGQLKDELCHNLHPIDDTSIPTKAFPPLRRVAQWPPVETLSSDKSPSIAPLFYWNPPHEKAQGLLIHRLLDNLTKMKLDPQQLTDAAQQRQCLAELKKNRSTYESELNEVGFDSSVTSQSIDQAFKAIRQTLADPRGHWLLSRQGDSEWQLSRQHSSPIRIDLSFIDNDIRWIVDYKTSGHLPFSSKEIDSFYRQLNGYAAALAPVETRPIRIAIYCPQDGYWQEWAYQPQQAQDEQGSDYEEYNEYE